MTRSKWFASIFGLLLAIAAGAAFFYFRESEPAPSVEAPAAESDSVSTSTAATLSNFQSAPPMKRVMDLYETESKRVGKVDPDPKLTEKRLRAAAKELSADEIAWLGAQAADTSSDMDSRFFAAYLLGLSGSASGINTLGQIALSSIPESKNEMRVQEERVLRMQTVEGILESCKLAGAKDKLLEIIAEQKDEAVRDRAHRALYACQTGKSLEQADKDALEKLTSPER